MPRTRPDPTHMQLRVCSPVRLFGGSVWVGFINGMVWPGRLASFVEERRNQTTTTTTVITTTTKSTTTSIPASQTTTSTTRLHTIVSSFLPLNHPLSKVVSSSSLPDATTAVDSPSKATIEGSEAWLSIPMPTRITLRASKLCRCARCCRASPLLLLPPASKVGATRRDAEKNVSRRAAGPPAVMQ